MNTRNNHRHRSAGAPGASLVTLGLPLGRAHATPKPNPITEG